MGREQGVQQTEAEVFLDGCPLESGSWLSSVISQGQDGVDVMLARPLLYLMLIFIYLFSVCVATCLS